MTQPPLQIDPSSAHKLPSCIWMISDGRPGHRTQLEGLAQQLAHISHASIVWTTPNDLRFGNPLKSTSHTEPPEMIVSAGHTTHRSLYYWSRRYKAFSAVLMKPSLPLRLFDAVICPAHDGLKGSSRVLSTQGVINKITPPSKQLKQMDQGCILLGGASKHFQWDTAAIVAQVLEVCAVQANTQWRLFDSPRTPPDTIPALRTNQIPNLKIYDLTRAEASTLTDALQQSTCCWVTPDSISMIYEALTAGCATGLFELRPRNKRPGRVVSGIQNLQTQGHVGSWTQWKTSATLPENTLGLWEADRAAHWLLDRFSQHASRHRWRRR